MSDDNTDYTHVFITYDDILECPKFYTKEMREEKAQLDIEHARLWNETSKITQRETEGKTTEEIIARWSDEPSQATKDIRKKWEEYRRRRDIFYSKVEKNYLELRSNDEIISDVKLVVNSIIQFDYTHYIDNILREILTYREIGSNEEYVKDIEKRYGKILTEGYEGCFNFILSYLDIPLKHFIKDEAYTKKIIDIVKARVGLWYTEPESNYLPVLSGRATNLSKFVKSSLLREDPIKKTITLGVGEGEDIIKAVMSKLEETRSKFGISTDKLLQTAIAQFADNNHVGETSRVLHTREVAIPLKEYAKKNNYDIEERPTNTPEEAKKEALRVKNTMKDVRKKVNKDLKILATTPLSWKEKVKGKTENYVDVYMLSAKGIVDGFICLKFNEDFASYLIRLPINQYPVALLGLDERKTTAYLIGKKLSTHYFMDSNQLHNRAQLLKVKTLLKETDLPTLEDVKRIRKSWVDRIKEPFERALDDLGGDYKDENLKDRRGCGLLESWEYCHTKGVPLTDKEKASLIDDFETWSETLIKFTLNDTPDQTDRLEAKRAKIEEEKRKKDKKDSQKKPSNKDQ